MKKQVRSLCPSSLVRICDPGNMFCMEKVVDGVKLLVLSHSRFNSRLRHMGHPIDVVGDDSEVDDDDDANSDDDEEGERGGDEEEDEDYDDEASDDMDADSPWLLHLPTRLSPVIAVLQDAYTGGGIILSVLMERLQLQFQISPHEVRNDHLFSPFVGIISVIYTRHNHLKHICKRASSNTLARNNIYII